MPSVLLLTFDTLRADHIGAYGYRRIRTPHLDALTEAGIVFKHAVAQAPLTPPSHASIFTGLYPAQHGIRAFEGQNTLLPGHTTLAEILKDAGYATGAIVAAAPLAPDTGLERGFDTYDFSFPPSRYPFFGFRESLLAKLLKRIQLVPDRDAYRNAEEQTDRALAWLSTHLHEQFFLWVHYFDAHDPYAPPSTRILELRADPNSSYLDVLKRAHLYDAEVAYLDEQVGRLIRFLEDNGTLDATIVVGVSDHGEGLGEHDYVGHSNRLFAEQIRIVLFIRYPQVLPEGRSVSVQVRSIDVLPTLLDLLELPPLDSAQGVSLLPLAAQNIQAPHRIAISETFEDPAARLVSASDGTYKLIACLENGSEQLFDTRNDPGELLNLISTRPAVASRLRTVIQEYLSETAATKDAVQRDLDAAVRQRLRALGYVK